MPQTAKLIVMKPGRKYCIINTDEPYIEAIYEVLKAGEIAKGTWIEGDITFEAWKESIPVFIPEPRGLLL